MGSQFPAGSTDFAVAAQRLLDNIFNYCDQDRMRDLAVKYGHGEMVFSVLYSVCMKDGRLFWKADVFASGDEKYDMAVIESTGHVEFPMS